MSEFSLKALAREVINEDESEDLAQMVKELRRRIPADATDSALEQALTPFVHEMVRAPNRHGGIGNSRPRPSAKVTAIREAWQRKLDEIRYTVADGSIRRLGDMTRDDVIFAAGQLEDMARRNKLRAMSMRSIAEAMTQHDASRVRDLPDGYLGEMFTGAAA